MNKLKTSTSGVPQLTLKDIAISKNEFSKVEFEETLHLVNLDGEIIDKVTVAVEAADGHLQVYQYSHNEDRMLRIQSSLSGSLFTLSEQRHIRWPSDRATMMRVTGVGTSYRVFTLCQDSGDTWRQKVEVETRARDPVLLEGANIVLLRKVAISRLRGQLRALAINHDMDLCDCLYDVRPGTPPGHITVVRTITDPKGTEVVTTVLTPEGRILSLRWSGSEWYLKAPTERVVSEVEGEEEVLHQETSAEEPPNADQRAYFERKDEVTERLRRYLLDHSEVQDLIADLLRNMVLEQPQDVVHFADTYLSERLGIDRLQEDHERSDNC